MLTRMVWLAVLGAAPLALVAAPSASAAPPATYVFSYSFADLDPCTGLDHTVTISGEVSEKVRDGRTVAHAKRTITTTPTGYVGRGTDSFVENGQLEKFTQTDILRNPTGDVLRAHSVILFDLATDTYKVEKLSVTCLGPG